MNCPRCSFPETVMLPRPTSLGYLRFWCGHCERTFNERTGTPFNFLEVPTDIMFQVGAVARAVQVELAGFGGDVSAARVSLHA